MSTELYLVAVALTTILSAARITRLAVYDEFPPIEWLRRKLKVSTKEEVASNHWKLLAVCGFCMSFWVSAVVIGAGLVAHVYGHPPNDSDTPALVWWIVNGIFAASYLAASYVARDGDDS